MKRTTKQIEGEMYMAIRSNVATKDAGIKYCYASDQGK